MPAPDPVAKAAYDALAAEYEQVSPLVAACRRHDARDRARTQLAYARRLFRIAAFQAPAEGETHEGFDRSLDAIRHHLAAARREITA
ncbi:hypothetical protein ACFSL4_01605 [Streptomyces caeni]|uniref:Uncharacterized protein n=1 Tax=Streptomyces caeni TaxID=2307231 RepID=A0ABW4IK01_9ACTN